MQQDRAFHRQHGLGCAAIDHILLVRPDNPRWTKVETVEHAAMAFKELAKELDIPIFSSPSSPADRRTRPTSLEVHRPGALRRRRHQASVDVMLGVTLPRKWLKQREPDESDRAHDEWVGKMERWKDKAEIGALKMRDDDDGALDHAAFLRQDRTGRRARPGQGKSKRRPNQAGGGHHPVRQAASYIQCAAPREVNLNEMIKRVADVLEARFRSEDYPGTDARQRQHMEDAAKEVFEAMREPTAAMIDALNECGGDTEAIWPRMIDAALKEQ
jgi:hypothetical protein